MIAPITTSQPRKVDKPRSSAELLRRYVSAYWLRPENALWMTLRSEAWSRVPFEAPSADLCCGDGVFTFLHLGGEFDPAFDVFAAGCDPQRGGIQGGDMFDTAGPDFAPSIHRMPHQTVTVGCDVKASLLEKAAKLRLYDRLIEHDCNRPLPLPDRSLRTIYCNAAYWLKNIDAFLGELWRVLSPGGRAILHVKLESFLRTPLRSLEPVLGQGPMDLLLGDRISCWPTIADRRTWEHRFIQAGFEIEDAAPFVTMSHAAIWEIGLRPIAPLLVRMANSLREATRSQIKREWVDLFANLAEPLCRPDLNLTSSLSEPVEMQFVLQRH